MFYIPIMIILKRENYDSWDYKIVGNWIMIVLNTMNVLVRAFHVFKALVCDHMINRIIKPCFEMH